MARELALALVIDRQATPPGSPADGDAYIVQATATGDWAGEEEKLAVYMAGQWEFSPPIEGMRVLVFNEQQEYLYLSNGFPNGVWCKMRPFIVERNTAYTSVTTAQDIGWNDYNDGGYGSDGIEWLSHDDVTNNEQITFNVAGIIRVRCSAQFQHVSGNGASLALVGKFDEGGGFATVNEANQTNGFVYTWSTISTGRCEFLRKVQQGDVMKIVAQRGGGASPGTINVLAGYMRLEIELLYGLSVD